MNVMDKDIIFIGGKGGVGKSTTSAALALSSAEAGYRTLLVSTDPAHNIGHIFEQEISGEVTEITENLFAIEIDPEAETKQYIQQVKANIREVVQPTMMEEVHRQLDTARASPGADEAALFDRLISIILRERQAFDQLIFDTAPTGHTIRLLTLPELLGIWMEGLLTKRHKTNEHYSRLLNDGEPVEDPIFDVLNERKERFAQARDIMLDGQTTGFIFVLTPEKLPILETKHAVDMLDQYHLHVRTLVVNRVLPDENQGPFFNERKKHEAVYLEQIRETFHDKQLHFVPYFSHDIIERVQLEAFSQYLKSE